MTIRAEDDNEGRGTSVASDGGSGDGDESGRPGKKKKANRACAACQKAHLTCDDGESHSAAGENRDSLRLTKLDVLADQHGHVQDV